jgi:hypothetical protein
LDGQEQKDNQVRLTSVLRRLFNTVAAACIASALIVTGCSGQAEPAVKGNQPAESGPTVILVENTSISLPLKQLKPDRDRFMESIHSFINSVLEGKSK